MRQTIDETGRKKEDNEKNNMGKKEDNDKNNMGKRKKMVRRKRRPIGTSWN